MSEHKTEILNFIRDELLDDEETIDENTSLFREQVLDSINLSEIMSFIEEKYNIKIKPMEVVYENFDTVVHMDSFISRKKSE